MDPIAAHNLRIGGNADLGDEFPGWEDPDEGFGVGVAPFVFTKEQLAAAAATRTSMNAGLTTLADKQADRGLIHTSCGNDS